MKGTSKSKVVTSGRLTGKVAVRPTRKRTTSASACPEPAYSLYSTDSEDQVTTLHKGLDNCAALLGDILQVEKEDSSSLPKAVKCGAAKSRPSPKLGKKTSKKLPLLPDQKSFRRVQRGSTKPQSAVPVKVPPPPKQLHAPLQAHTAGSSLSSSATSLPKTSISPQIVPQKSDSQSSTVAQHTHCKAGFEEHGDFVPVRDIDPQNVAVDTNTHTHEHTHSSIGKISNTHTPEPLPRDTHTHSHSHSHSSIGKISNTHTPEPLPRDTHSHSHTHSSTVKSSNTHTPEPLPRDTHTTEEGDAVKTVRCLLGEVKALIAGQGSAAERLLRDLEHTMSSPLMHAGTSDTTEPDVTSLQSHNTELSRQVKILQQQLKEKEEAERQKIIEPLCNSEVLSLQTELAASQSRLQEVQNEVTELRQALEDTQSQLRDTQAANDLIKTDLEATRSQLLDSERDKSELESLAQQRLEQIGNLNRTLQILSSPDCLTVINDNGRTNTNETLFNQRQQHRPEHAEHSTERITQYLMSLPTNGQANATQEQNKLAIVPPRDTLPPHTDTDRVQQFGRRSHAERRLNFNYTLSRCDEESMCSDSTFNTKDEAAFRDGLAALDKSIASLQKTIKLDLGR